MGVCTYGEAQFKFSRALTDEEHSDWLKRLCDPELRFDAGGWGERVLSTEFEFNGSSWGDIGQVHTDLTNVELIAEGKVYGITEALGLILSLLPGDVAVKGGGTFETEGDHWALEVGDDGRSVFELEGRIEYGESDTGELIRAAQEVLKTYGHETQFELPEAIEGLRKAVAAAL